VNCFYILRKPSVAAYTLPRVGAARSLTMRGRTPRWITAGGPGGPGGAVLGINLTTEANHGNSRRAADKESLDLNLLLAL
jgi:hypothetical protein